MFVQSKKKSAQKNIESAKGKVTQRAAHNTARAIESFEAAEDAEGQEVLYDSDEDAAEIYEATAHVAPPLTSSEDECQGATK